MSADLPPVLIAYADTDTGYRLAQLLRRSERNVIAVMRPRADTALIKKLGCTVERADPTERADIDAVLGAHANHSPEVVCAIGGTPALNTQGNLNIIAAAVEHRVRRFVLLTSVGCGDSIAALDPFVKAFVGKAVRAKNWAEAQVRTTDLDWTIIRPGGMVRRATRGTPILVENPNVSGHINVVDLGDLIFQVLNSPSTIGRTLTAVDDARASDIRGEPLIPAEL